MTDIEIANDAVGRFGAGVTVRKLRRTYGIGYKRARRIKNLIANGAEVSIDVSGDKATVESSGWRIRTLDDLLSAAKVDTSRWIVERFTANSWEGPASGGGVQQFFQVKATLRRNKAVDLAELVNAIRVQMADIPTPVADGDHLLVVSPADAHFGKYAWWQETGANYDVHIARRSYEEAVAHLYDMASKLGDIARVAFIVGNDLLHVDRGGDQTTTAGTRVDTDTRWQKAYREALAAVISSIEMLAKLAPVDVIIQPGNHDREKVQTLGFVLEQRYHNVEHVQVLNSPADRRYYRFGKVLLGITHGDTVKINQLPLLMAQEVPSEWGDSEWREWLIGHFHVKREASYLPLSENGGVRVRVLPSLSAPDAWHMQRGFIANRASEAILYHEQYGYVATLNHNVRD